MFSLLRRFAVVALAAAVLAPMAVADDLRSPDTRDRAEELQGPNDLRSPDTRDRAEELRGPYDRRSPDTRDVAAGIELSDMLVRMPPPVFLEEDDFDWVDAGVGAAASIGAALILLGSVSLAAGRRRRPVGP